VRGRDGNPGASHAFLNCFAGGDQEACAGDGDFRLAVRRGAEARRAHFAQSTGFIGQRDQRPLARIVDVGQAPEQRLAGSHAEIHVPRRVHTG
jgi:hypothetical protein